MSLMLTSPTLQVIACQYHGSLGIKWSCPSQIKKSSPLIDRQTFNFAQGLLQKEHEQLSGLQSTLLLDKRTSVSPSLQIIHSQDDHWIVATTIRSPVKIFDSLYPSTDPSTRELDSPSSEDE